MNPYKNFKYDPFQLAVIYDMPAPVFETLKKLLCAGIDGRAKSESQDLLDAMNTLILCHERKNSFLIARQKGDRTASPNEIVEMYGLSGLRSIAVLCFLYWVLSDYQSERYYSDCLTTLGVVCDDSKPSN